ncbi:ABC transporter permease [Acidiphilium acidophilum]|uniref:ABC transporter permease n=1 Tax=Acidiphilium acidophilum TaxID=76588 RepID=A0AAW9DU61_ACIAO|nr:ABC transporter permease [Acidiphilium acidophilum]MDX5932759.1 ABC transporter permease [Acidiphilium acidophilum]GBR73286.1 ABC transporter permease [Acidiphilium acidophilum DSM 700]
MPARLATMLAQRLGLALITLWLLSMVVFAGAQLLPGNVGRAILGPLASPVAVATLNRQLGTNLPIPVQYWRWISNFVTGNMGISYTYRTPVAPFVIAALLNSLKLAAVAFVIVVPLSIIGGVYAAMHARTWIDKTISIAGLSMTVIPEFVSSIILILILGIWLHWLPIAATPPPHAGPLVVIDHLILPALPLVFILFGYIARMARAGTIDALDADYTRTAILKGLPRSVVIRRHVLRNALLPTITVVATQVGYLVGGLVIVETLFRYQGIGSLILTAARSKDFPMLEGGILTIGIVYVLVTMLADIALILLNPRLRTGGR